MMKDCQLLLVQKDYSLPIVKLLIFLLDNTFFNSHGLRTGVFRIDWVSLKNRKLSD